MSLRIALVGATGRMGQAVTRLAGDHDAEIVCAIGTRFAGQDVGTVSGTRPSGTLITPDLAEIARTRANVAIDFSTPDVSLALFALCKKENIACVSGTTGFGDREEHALRDASESCAMLWEANMSIGVHVLFDLVAQASSALADFDAEIVEAHHARKADAPSGTALRLADAVESSRASERVFGRSGRPGPRKKPELGIHAVRGGDVVGEHTVMFLGTGERLELTHRATSRDVFATGALRAARWLHGRPAGLYRLADVIAAG